MSSIDTIAAAQQALEDKSVSAVELTQALLTRIEQQKGTGAYLYVDHEGALQQAKDTDARRDKGESLGPLDGIPVGLKDIIVTRGVATTCASQLLRDYIPPYDATVTTRLRAAGAVLLGKLNMDEFAMGSSNEHSSFGSVKNPWNPDYVPGGSSGGSAAAVASCCALGTLGTDTGGSIRQPASFTGIVGLKPTYGRVSRYGVVAFASSLDQVGPMAWTTQDCAMLLDAIAGHDPLDSTSAQTKSEGFAQALGGDLKGMRLGLPKEYFVDGVDDQVRKAVEDAAAFYKSAGAEVVEVSLPHTDYAIATYYLICTAEASSNLARYDGVRYGNRAPADSLGEMYTRTRSEGFGREVKRRIILGTYALSAGYYDAYYGRAQKVRTLITQDFEQAFETVDALITPTTPTAAFRLGENLADPMKMYLADIFTVGCNLAGLPGLSLPCGFTQDGLPIGLQLIGPHWSEAKLLQLGHAYEQGHDWHTRRPS